ncbi:Gonadotropin-releasing hormone receptor [Halotydeus destructor]|nr:Gonadotropin-releasing hormone receptor [Halotydeus destructor]
MLVQSNLAVNSSCVEHYLDEEYGDRRRYYVIAMYTFLSLIGAIINVSVITSLLQIHSSRVKILMVNLCIADMVVVFVVLPMETIRRFRGFFLSGELGCKSVQTLRIFGPYLSSMVLICISLDRYFAITKSVRSHNNRFRFKMFLAGAWILSVAFAVPQAIVSQVDADPNCPTVYRCETITYFSSRTSSVLYRIMKLGVIYFLPLGVIVYCYFYICSHVIKHSNELRRYSYDGISTISTGSSVRSDHSSLRSAFSSSLSSGEKARARIQRTTRQTIRMTIIIVTAFVLCWTPYTIVDLVSILAPNVHATISPVIKDAVLLIAYGNSVINPLIYGSHINVFRTAYRRYRRKI